MVSVPFASRRVFLKRTALGTAGILAAPSIVTPSIVRAAPKPLTMMHESSFIPPYDAYFKNKIAAAYEKATGTKVNYEVVSVGSLLTRVTTTAENGSGPDMTQIGFNWAFLFNEKFVDVTDIAAEIGAEGGGWYPNAQEAVVVDGKWKAIPFGNIGQLMNWRTDWFKEAGYEKFPDTWDELLEAGIKLKKNGHPFGFELGHGFGDNHGWLYPLLWSYGAREVEADGKTIVIDSDETARAVDYCRRFYKETMVEDCLGWTDVGNNKAFLSEQISCTNNAESILWAAKKDFPEMAKVIDQSPNPKGPKGSFAMLNPLCHAIFSHTPDQKAAKDFVRWLMKPEQAGAWYDIAITYYQPFLHKYDDAPMWNVEPKNKPFRDTLSTAHLPGWPAPLSRAQSETIAKYVVIDMFAKACAGKSTKDVIAEAKTQLTQIYKTA
jgi:multiple sugar transport system substrate-binding protein